MLADGRNYGVHPVLRADMRRWMRCPDDALAAPVVDTDNGFAARAGRELRYLREVSRSRIETTFPFSMVASTSLETYERVPATGDGFFSGFCKFFGFLFANWGCFLRSLSQSAQLSLDQSHLSAKCGYRAKSSL